ncbi:MAG: AAA family ATPase [Elusimicrobiota bacterium]
MPTRARTCRRYIESAVLSDLRKKMVCIGGPRQVGKTTFSFGLLGKGADESHPAYLTWDDVHDREALLRAELPPGQRLVLLDEIHKFARWPNLVPSVRARPAAAVRRIS